MLTFLQHDDLMNLITEITVRYCVDAIVYRVVMWSIVLFAVLCYFAVLLFRVYFKAFQQLLERYSHPLLVDNCQPPIGLLQMDEVELP